MHFIHQSHIIVRFINFLQTHNVRIKRNQLLHYSLVSEVQIQKLFICIFIVFFVLLPDNLRQNVVSNNCKPVCVIFSYVSLKTKQSKPCNKCYKLQVCRNQLPISLFTVIGRDSLQCFDLRSKVMIATSCNLHVPTASQNYNSTSGSSKRQHLVVLKTACTKVSTCTLHTTRISIITVFTPT